MAKTVHVFISILAIVSSSATLIAQRTDNANLKDLKTSSREVALERVREPLPIDAVLSVKAHNSLSAFDLSPDGEWLAHTWETDESVSRPNIFTPTGVSYAEGTNRMQAALTNVKSGQMIKMGSATNFNWAPVWSPDGSRVAYYSDEGGESGIWIWEKATGKAQRFPGVIARTFFGFEIVRWSSDSRRILSKILPEGMSVAEANALLPDRFPKTVPNEPSVRVFKSLLKECDAPKEQARKLAAADWTNAEFGDLAILDIRSLSVTRIAKRAKPQWWAFSPDERYVAYTSWLGIEPNSQQPIYQIVLYDMISGQSRILAPKIRLGYGIELNWSPDSRQIAYIDSGRQSNGEIVAISVTDGTTKTFSEGNMPSFGETEGKRPPLWDASGQNLYAIGNDGRLWKIQVASGHGLAIGDFAGHLITAIVARAGSPTLWTTDNGHTAWVIASERSGTKAGIFRVDFASGQIQPAIEDDEDYLDSHNLDASGATGEIAYVAQDQQHLPDAWAFNTASRQAHQITHLNESIEHYELGTARVIDWYGGDGQKLRGTLLLPPGYRKEQRVPLVVWVYGGHDGSRDVNTFGLSSDPMFNFHILATRGYAVLSPDAPLREGMPMHDLMSTVIPGVNAAIAQGYADPDRLAVMGQSYGSYCTLALISQTRLFKAAVITGAVVHPEPESPDLRMGYYEHGQGNLHGTPWDQHDRYLANSPIYLFDQVETPLLIGEGSKDTFAHNLLPSDATFAALKRLGKDVEYRIYKDEGHVLANKPNVIDFWERRLEFLAQHLDLALDARGRIILDGGYARSRNMSPSPQ
jgi:dipeptidyl aminopeptidase/acylaminoacyl peptidase